MDLKNSHLMTRQELTLRDLELLVAINQAGSLSKAATCLQCTASALSHRIHDLESRLNRTLVERRGRLQLTPAALSLVPAAEDILARMALMSRELAVEQDIRRIGISTLLLDGPYLAAMTDVINSGSALYEVRTGHSLAVEDWVDRGEVDVGLVRLERLRHGLHYQLVAEDRLVVVSRAPVEGLGTIESWPWVLFSAQMGHGAAVQQALRDAGVVLKPQATVDSLAVALALVERGAVSVLPWSLAGPLVESGRLVEVEVQRVLWPPRRNVILTRDPPPGWLSVLVHAVRRHL